jgi:phosphocarrier protein
MVRQKAFIQNRRGLHARASAQVVKLAESFEAKTSIYFQDMCVSAQSIMGLLMLGAGQGACIFIEGEGSDADQAVAAIVDLINNQFGEG